MILEQIYTGCLAEAAYYIESDGEAAVIDPLRETEPYLNRAKESGANIKYVFETHFHADFVSGHIDLAEKANAQIVYGPGANPSYEVINAHDGQEFKIGKIKLIAIHTPGHTAESTTWLLKDEAGKDHAIFSGDTLFIGDVGRPDLAAGASLSQDELAGMLFDSLRNKIMPLHDDVMVYPAHGAGSACGKNMSSETFSTLGEQKRTNYALRADMTKEEFVKEVTDGLAPPPAYFPENVRLNKGGYQSFDLVMEKGNTPLSVDEFVHELEDANSLIIDTRSKEYFAKAYIPCSIFIGLDGSFAPWAATMVPELNRPIVVIAEEGRESEAVKRLSRVGFDNVKGYLKGGVNAWENAGRFTTSIDQIEAAEIASKVEKFNQVLDVRKNGEYESAHVDDAVNYPLAEIDSWKNDLPKDQPWYIHCKSGYRSLIAASVLKKNGFHNVYDIKGGFLAIEETELPITETCCGSSCSVS